MVTYIRMKNDLSLLEGFEWDRGNLEHIEKHKVDYRECEEVFVNLPVIVNEDETHSQSEERLRVYGQTNKGRLMLIISTVRKNVIRVISARNQNKKKGGNMKKLKTIPKFKNEDEEDKFWSTHDTTDYFDIRKAIVNPSFPNLKLSTKSITIRVPESLLYSLKMLANKKDVPYQSLVKIFLDEKIREEIKIAR